MHEVIIRLGGVEAQLEQVTVSDTSLLFVQLLETRQSLLQRIEVPHSPSSTQKDSSFIQVTMGKPSHRRRRSQGKSRKLFIAFNCLPAL
jgi:hypothetical protein